MSYYNEDFYHEPSEFEQQVDELKATLLNSVKDEFKEEMERLRKENAELQEVKQRMKEMENEHKRKLYDLDYEKRNLESKVRQERLDALLKGFEVELYTIGYKSYRAPKCDKCDENRRIHYKTPLGKETYETCDCGNYINVYEPMPTLLKEFSIRSGEGVVWYEVRDSGNCYEHLGYYDDSINGKEMITSEEQFEGKGTYKVLLQTKELAQKYCDYINKGKKAGN
ncbi:hypothetical protein 7S4_33 [uncultured Caudovirales phage]|uniref:Uncharacterized protein n=1 Tax=uncultured Caudovirales phage TaxID=2100421 RepID=A0A2H4JB05_9CAUD|nr:hypothetical protein 7S4_33 [uncultured Caudovirales phage]